MSIKEERGANSQLDMSRLGGKIDALMVVVTKVERRVVQAQGSG